MVYRYSVLYCQNMVFKIFKHGEFYQNQSYTQHKKQLKIVTPILSKHGIFHVDMYISTHIVLGYNWYNL